MVYDKTTDKFTTAKADTFSQHQSDNNIRVLTNSEKDKIVIILHDFY